MESQGEWNILHKKLDLLTTENKKLTEKVLELEQENLRLLDIIHTQKTNNLQLKGEKLELECKVVKLEYEEGYIDLEQAREDAHD